MAAESDEVPVIEALRGLVDMTSGMRRLILVLAERYGPEADAEEDASLLSARLRCIVADRLNPAIESLESLLEDLQASR